MTRSVFTCALLCAGFLLVSEARSEEVLDNQSVVRMINAGLSPDVVELKIAQTAGHFDVSTDALIALKRAGLPDGVIKAMILKGESDEGHEVARQTARPPIGPSAAPIAAQPPSPASGDSVCGDVRYFTTGNEGWSWVPSNVCVDRSSLSIDQQRFSFSSIAAHCREKSLGLSIGGDAAEWWIVDATDTYKLRGGERTISDLESALVRVAPGVVHGPCSSRIVRSRSPRK